MRNWFKKGPSLAPLSFDSLKSVLRPEEQAMQDLEAAVDLESSGYAYAVRLVEHLREAALETTEEEQKRVEQKHRERDEWAASIPAPAAAETQIDSEGARASAATGYVYDLHTPLLCERAFARQDAEIMLRAFKLRNGLELYPDAEPPFAEFKSWSRLLAYCKLLTRLLLFFGIEMGLNVYFIKEDMTDKWAGSIMLSLCAIVPLGLVAILGWPLVCRCLRHVTIFQKMLGLILLGVFVLLVMFWMNISTMTRGIIYTATHGTSVVAESGGADMPSEPVTEIIPAELSLQEALKRFAENPISCMTVPQVAEGGYFTLVLWIMYLLGVMRACHEGNLIFGTPYWGYWRRQKRVSIAASLEQDAWDSFSKGLVSAIDSADDSLDSLDKRAKACLAGYRDAQKAMGETVRRHNDAVGLLPQHLVKLWALYKRKIDQLHRSVGKKAASYEPALKSDLEPSLPGCMIEVPEDESTPVQAKADAVTAAVDMGRIRVIAEEVKKFNALKDLCGHFTQEMARRHDQTLKELEKKLWARWGLNKTTPNPDNPPI